MALKILSISCLYPHPGHPGKGTFLRSRLQHVARWAELKIVAPIALLEAAECSTAVPANRNDENIEVLHPRWGYLPGTGCITPLLLGLQLLRPLSRVRESFRFNLIDAHFGYPDGIAAALVSWSMGIPFCVTLRGSEVLHGRYPTRRILMRWALRRAGRVITVSQRLHQFAITLGVDSRRIKTIPNGIESSIFYPRDRVTARQRFGIDERVRLIVTAGHLIELKGHHHVIQSVKRLAEQRLPVRLLIAGGAPNRGVTSFETHLRSLVSELKIQQSVEFLGQLSPETLADLMSAADVFCLASSREGWPNVVHEALACGTPVVATDVGAVRELIPSDCYGLIIPASDPMLLDDALSRALETTWDREAIAAWGQSRSWEQVAKEVLREMYAVIAERQRTVLSNSVAFQDPQARA